MFMINNIVRSTFKRINNKYELLDVSNLESQLSVNSHHLEQWK